MGVPKFYRWISERYPCLSEVVKEFQLPEFDNLYLDMNGIIHVCSHPDDENPHFRITEEKIFTDICHYIDFLFRMIKPRKVFFMAVDGVAPRAKMNQQRGRRFRSAREAEELIEKAKQAGETLPTEKRFDSNCITPGTPFMVRLQEHLKYFVVDKVSGDPLWQDVSVYLSGHETPGEGEHKVMDYIRWSKSQPGHNGNTRHCFYGLDADLIMLGLTSHEPNFSLLREEVKFGGKKDRNKRPTSAEETTFHLLHLSLMRDYLGYEFSPLKDKLPFQWDLECLIDDWILMGFLVGNDFIPHLPNFHIHHDSLPQLWSAYMKVLPTLGGYINERGHLNLPRLEKYFEELRKFDDSSFENAFSDLKYLESKLGGRSINESAGSAANDAKRKPTKKQRPPPKFGYDDLGVLNAGDIEMEAGFFGIDSDSDDGMVESTMAEEFALHKKDYYMSKLKLKTVGPEQLQDLAEGYVRAIQWILLYYFEGVPSWSWYYPHHYSPYISDVQGFKDMKMEFDLSTPFLPFQQLMAVLPAASRELLPAALQPLMTEPTSPVIDFYPVDFENDLNGKQQSWEAVVLIPFIDEVRLLSAMKTREPLMTREEHGRNSHGPHLLYTYTDANMGFYPSTLPGTFPDISMSRAKCNHMEKAFFRIESSKLKKGLGADVDLNVYYPGFPTLKHIPHSHKLKSIGVKVFQQNSRNMSMLLQVEATPDVRLEELADELLGKTIFVGWPHMHEARVTALANESHRIELQVESGKTASVTFNRKPLTETMSAVVAREATTIKERHKDRFAIDVGNTDIIVYASPMTGRTYTYGHTGTITLDKQFASQPTPYVYQLTKKDLQVQESGHTTFKTLEEVFPTDSTIFMLGTPHYGAQGKVIEVLNDSARVRIALDVTVEPDLQQLGLLHMKDRYWTAFQAGQQIGVSTNIVSRITGSVFVEKRNANPKQQGGKVNIGLNLKFTKREEEVPGYTRKEENGWTYSKKCVEVISEYINSYSSLWQRISSARSTTDNYTEDDLFPESGSYKMSDVVKFIEELPSSKAPKMKFGCELLDSDQVARIESMTAKIVQKTVIVKMKIKPRLLFRPLTDLGSIVPDPNTDFLLYDRIVVVKAGYSVPFGKRGTIIGIPMEESGALSPHSVYDVVFDEPFSGGITLRCSPNRGYRVPGSSMLNITYGEFRKNRPVSERPTAGVWNKGRNSRPGMNGSNNNSSPQSLHGVRWDSKRQPLFGQVFADNNGSGQSPRVVKPEFVTPRVQAPQPVLASKANMKTESVDFNSVWKNLQSQKNTKPEDFPALESSVPVSSADSTKPKPTSPYAHSPSSQKTTTHPNSKGEPPIKILSNKHETSPSSKPPASTQQYKQSTIPLVQSLFANPAKTGSASPQAPASTENAEFMAMFNSLKLQTEELQQQKSKAENVMSKNGALTVEDLERAEETKLDAEAKEADNAIKQMLKIGSGGSSQSKSNSASPSSGASPRSPSTFSSALPPNINPNPNASSVPAPPFNSASASYGRQVSLQELFDQANRQLKTQEPKKKDDVKVEEKKNPVKELESYCASNGLAPPAYDFRHPGQQITFIASVLIPGRGRYEGSVCPDKMEAAQSAAGIALLCMNKPKNMPNVKTPFIPGAPRPGVMHPLFSQNSAFSPIGLPGTGQPPHRIQQQQQQQQVQQQFQVQQPDLMQPPPLLTPRHFAPSQPPPPHHPLAAHLPPPTSNQPPNPMLEQLHRQLQQLATQFHIQQQTGQAIPQQAFNNLMATPNIQQMLQQPLPSMQPPPHQQHHQPLSNQMTAQPPIPSQATGKVPSSSASSSVGQPFIPLQVSRNQKTAKGIKKDDEHDSSFHQSSGKSPATSGEMDNYRKLDNLFNKESASESSSSPHQKISPAAFNQSSKNNNDSDRPSSPSSQDFGFSTQPFSPNGLPKDDLNNSTNTNTSLAATISGLTAASGRGANAANKKDKPVMQKKKSRLAANFSKKEPPASQSLSQTK